MSSQIWSATAVIVVGYIIGFYFQSRSITHLDKRIDDLRSEMNARLGELRSEMNARFVEMNARLTDLKDLLHSEIRRVEERLERQTVRGQ